MPGGATAQAAPANRLVCMMEVGLCLVPLVFGRRDRLLPARQLDDDTEIVPPYRGRLAGRAVQ
jgi:hypothetical protein